MQSTAITHPLMAQLGRGQERKKEATEVKQQHSKVTTPTLCGYLLEPFDGIHSITQSSLVDTAKASFSNLQVLREAIGGLDQFFQRPRKRTGRTHRIIGSIALDEEKRIHSYIHLNIAKLLLTPWQKNLSGREWHIKPVS